MTFKDLLYKFDYADIVPHIEREVVADVSDRRPSAVKMEEMKQGFDHMRSLKPTFGYIDLPIRVTTVGDRLCVGNTHIGAVSDLLSRRLEIAPTVEASEQEILAGCVYQLVAHEAAWIKYRDDDDFDDLDNPVMSRGMR